MNLGYETKVKQVKVEPNEHPEWHEEIEFHDLPEFNVKTEFNEETESSSSMLSLSNVKTESDELKDVLGNSDSIGTDTDAENESLETQTHYHRFSVSTQTDDRLTGMSSDTIARYREKIAFLEKMLSTSKSVSGNDNK